MKRQPYRPILITDARPSQDVELRSRQVRYLVMMSIRVVCLIAAVILVAARPPLLWLWLTICVAGMVLMPWLAVLVANDRPAKQEHRLAGRFRRQAGTGPPALPPQPYVWDDDEPRGEVIDVPADPGEGDRQHVVDPPADPVDRP